MNTRAGLSNLSKIYWPEEGYTKGDVIDYYDRIADYILPYLRCRPQNLSRHPNGIKKKSFFQKDVGNLPPDWVEIAKIYSVSNEKYINYMVCRDRPTLLYMVNLGCIEFHPWNARQDNIEKPDYAVIDLDPEKINFKETVKTALVVKDLLDSIKIKSFCKTSGGRGLHIFIPLGAKYHYKSVTQFTKLVGHITRNLLPDIVSLERVHGQGRIYFDYQQNNKGQTVVSAYSLRPKPGATVSTPLDWSEVKTGLDPKKFNIKTIFSRLDHRGDPWQGIFDHYTDIEGAFYRLREKYL
ncbi:MAG: non-homologous end-joining DNA ligase [Candidatus Falkowbacteria bacterium]